MKSHVSIEQKMCIVCTKPYDTDTILLDKRLRNSLENTTITGFGDPCESCQKNIDDDRVALIGIDKTKAKLLENGNVDPRFGRTGEIAFIRKSVWAKVFSSTVPPKNVAFIDQKVLDLWN